MNKGSYPMVYEPNLTRMFKNGSQTDRSLGKNESGTEIWGRGYSSFRTLVGILYRKTWRNPLIYGKRELFFND